MSDENKKPDDEKLAKLKEAYDSYNHTMDQIEANKDDSSLEARIAAEKLMRERFQEDVEAISTPPKGKGGGRSR